MNRKDVIGTLHQVHKYKGMQGPITSHSVHCRLLFSFFGPRLSPRCVPQCACLLTCAEIRTQALDRNLPERKHVSKNLLETRPLCTGKIERGQTLYSRQRLQTMPLCAGHIECAESL